VDASDHLTKLLEDKEAKPVGTDLYAAPEQSEAIGYLTPAADLYALGCVLFEMLTGKRYKPMRRRTAPSALQPEVPGWLDKVVVKALAEDPWDRWQSAAEMAQALKEGMRAKSAPRPKARGWALVVVLGLILLVTYVLFSQHRPPTTTSTPAPTSRPETTAEKPVAVALPPTDTLTPAAEASRAPLTEEETTKTVTPSATPAATATIATPVAKIAAGAEAGAPLPTPTLTPLPPTPTPTRPPTATPVPPTVTPTPTATHRPPTSTATPAPPTATLTRTPVPSTATPTPTATPQVITDPAELITFKVAIAQYRLAEKAAIRTLDQAVVGNWPPLPMWKPSPRSRGRWRGSEVRGYIKN